MSAVGEKLKGRLKTARIPVKVVPAAPLPKRARLPSSGVAAGSMGGVPPPPPEWLVKLTHSP